MRGQPPRLISISGTLNEPGVEIEALDSASGFATLTDKNGRFVLPYVDWYPGAAYDLVFNLGKSGARRLRIVAPSVAPTNGVFDAGVLDLAKAEQVDRDSLQGLNSMSYEAYDSANAPYYESQYQTLTGGKTSDEQRIDALNEFVATKYDPNEAQWEIGSPRRVLETGSRYCGHLSDAMATMLETGGYRTRVINLSDGLADPHTHAVIEVWYGDAWHLYDPTYGVKFVGEGGKVRSYDDLRLDQSGISDAALDRLGPKVRRRVLSWMPAVYASGYHHFYYLKRK